MSNHEKEKHFSELSQLNEKFNPSNPSKATPLTMEKAGGCVSDNKEKQGEKK